MEIASVAIKQALFCNITKDNLGTLIQRAHTSGLHVEVSDSAVIGTTNVMVSFGFHMGDALPSATDKPDIRMWNLLQWAKEEGIIT